MLNTRMDVASQLRAEMPLFTGPNWDYGSLRRVYEAIEKIAFDDLGLDIYPVQIEVITSEQMLDAYSSVGMPLFSSHAYTIVVSGRKMKPSTGRTRPPWNAR